MFNLENAIGQWRYESGLGEDISQRETQLRESLASLQQQGLSEEEAFMVASHRVGRTANKTIEYETESPVEISYRDRLYWMIAGGLAMMVGMVIVDIVVVVCGIVISRLGFTHLFSSGVVAISLIILADAIAVIVLQNIWLQGRRGWNFGTPLAIAATAAFIVLSPAVLNFVEAKAFVRQAPISWEVWDYSYNYAAWVSGILIVVAMAVALHMLGRRRSRGQA